MLYDVKFRNVADSASTGYAYFLFSGIHVCVAESEHSVYYTSTSAAPQVNKYSK